MRGGSGLSYIPTNGGQSKHSKKVEVVLGKVDPRLKIAGFVAMLNRATYSNEMEAKNSFFG